MKFFFCSFFFLGRGAVEVVFPDNNSWYPIMEFFFLNLFLSMFIKLVVLFLVFALTEILILLTNN